MVTADLQAGPATEAQNTPAVPPAQLRTGTLALLVLWPVVVLGLGGGLAYRTLKEQLAADLANRPPVAVLDPAKFIQGGAGGGPKQVQEGITNAMLAADKLRKAGYVVIDRQAVLGVPADAEVRAP